MSERRNWKPAENTAQREKGHFMDGQAVENEQKVQMTIDRREFLKAAGRRRNRRLPAGLFSRALAGTGKPVREFHFSASPAKGRNEF